MEGDILDTLLVGNGIGAPTILVKKSAFISVGGFDTSYKCFEDWEFVIRFSKEYQIGFVKETLLDCYISNTGISSNTEAHYDARCKMLGQYKQEMIRAGVLECVVKDISLRALKAGVYKAVEQKINYYLNDFSEGNTEKQSKRRQDVLIPPIPKEYISYSEQEAAARTEEIYEEIGIMYKRVDVILDDYKKRINYLLKKEVSASQLCKFFEEKDTQILCRALNEFHVFRLLCRIAEEEDEFHEPCLMQNFQTMEEAVDWLQLCIFCVRDFEFDRETGSELVTLIKDKKMSYIFLAELITNNWIVQKIHTAERVALYLYENSQGREALLFLMRLEQMLPYSEEKIMTFAIALLNMGECRLAYEVLMKYQNPNEETRQMQEELRGLLQENLENE